MNKKYIEQLDLGELSPLEQAINKNADEDFMEAFKNEKRLITRWLEANPGKLKGVLDAIQVLSEVLEGADEMADDVLEDSTNEMGLFDLIYLVQDISFIRKSMSEEQIQQDRKTIRAMSKNSTAAFRHEASGMDW